MYLGYALDGGLQPRVHAGPAPEAFRQLATARGESPVTQAPVKGIAMTTAENIWIN